ncbi:uncharacterized protein G2W53_001812 [Senna tora]|uniref:Uncharacterized protein n=1 Tax=Senna tora TaxID=362788 RepID=A0A835CMW3_9FABA|nr:uncharacterized protein G2W53_001812 [Senna tora]
MVWNADGSIANNIVKAYKRREEEEEMAGPIAEKTKVDWWREKKGSELAEKENEEQ